MDFEGYRLQIWPEAILQRRVSPLSTDLRRFRPGPFLADSKGVSLHISSDFSEMLFSFDFGGYRSQIQPKAILHQ
ncbi:unnamed protein product [Linum trigynum]|uniref:Uncharacterized protein n=1 Tax=Linum trigynum TaxID=586398 RepID=A0AAV2EKH9_9ROSI